ncbi:hypothetical protein BC629DRAFT_89830 [Irpex lacteus]|nr:hypothetical protein BC629DRAFT_89830 [Irpex lacteus]
MPKAARKKWYAVRKGWDGPRIYSTWEEVSRFPGAEFKSFTSEAQAEAWLQAGVGMSYNAESSQSSNGTTPPATPSTSQESVASSSAPIIVPNQGPPLLGPVPSADSHTSDPSDDSGSDSDMDTEVPGVPAVPPEGPAKPPTEPAVKLSAEQQHVLDLVQSRKSVFFTGSAGTGKSVLLREIIKWYEAKHINFAVTASTGIAAVNIGGCTLHSWAGIGLGKEPEEKLAGKILGQERWQRRKEREERIRKGLPPGEEEGDYYDKSNSRALKRWTSCQVLIIDEISMLDGKLFDKLEFVARALRKNEEPFGGIQVGHQHTIPRHHTWSLIPRSSLYYQETSVSYHQSQTGTKASRSLPRLLSMQSVGMLASGNLWCSRRSSDRKTNALWTC